MQFEMELGTIIFSICIIISILEKGQRLINTAIADIKACGVAGKS